MATRRTTPDAAASPSTPSRRGALSDAQVDREVSRMAREVEWSLGVPGRHYSGLSYDELLDVLEAQGRDFRGDTSALRRAVLADVQIRLAGIGRAPTWAEFRALYAEAVLAWVVKRFDAKVRDVPVRRLTVAYAKRKAADGYGGNPIGTRTGSLAARVEDYGRVTVTR